MKLKTILATIFAASFMLFSSCGSVPERHEDMIEDAVKFAVAKNKFIVESINSGKFNYHRPVFKINSASVNDPQKPIVEILEEMSTDEGVNAILKLYNSSSIILTEYQKDSAETETQRWTFTEENTGVDFEFIQSGEDYLCEPIFESEEKYIEDNSPLYKYEEEIDDFVKYSIAMSDFYIADKNKLIKLMNNPLLGSYFYNEASLGGLIDPYEQFNSTFEKLVNVVDECYQQDSTVTTYKEALDRLSKNKKNEYNREIVEVLKNYNATDIRLSDYMPLSMSANVSAWQFTEANTGIAFIFKYYAEEESWDCIGKEESVNLYIRKRIK